MSPSVTVLMSVYNGEEYLDAAVESILRQTYEDFEFLIIDDASTDESRSCLLTWAEKDDRIRLVLKDVNEGLGQALHDGVNMAQAPLIARMDGDDVAMPDRLEKQVAYFDEHPEADILGSWAVDIDEEGREKQYRRYPKEHDEIVRLIWTNPLVHPSVMMRKDAIESVGSYDPDVRKRQDYELWFRCVAGGLRFANYPEALLRYRFTGDYYDRNDLKVAWRQAKIGWQGCRRVGAGPMAYIGVAVPLFRSLLPRALNAGLHNLLHRVDPRRDGDV
jgi:glycosyltransferase involved in cell wall biosynthesis